MEQLSRANAIKTARENATASMQRIRYLQDEYLKDVVHDALAMRGYAGDEKSASELAYWVLGIAGGRPADWVRKYTGTHERTGRPAIRRKPVRDYDPDLDPALHPAAMGGARGTGGADTAN